MLDSCKRLERSGFRVTYLTPDARGMVSPDDVKLFHYVESAEEAWSWLEREYGFNQPETRTGDLALDI